MFANLIESASHHKEMVRKSRFFLATLVGYALVFGFAGVASIFAYDAHLENQDMEMLVLVAPVDAPLQAEVAQANQPRTSASNPSNENRMAERSDLIAPMSDSTKVPDGINSKPSSVPELPKGNFRITDRNIDGTGPYNPNLPVGNNPQTGNASGPVVAINDIPTPPPIIKKDPPKVPPVVSKGVINGQATYKPNPPYPQIAKAAGIQGLVSVQILVDETGKVISAHAYSGNALLRRASEQAALQARFTPTMLSGVAVKVSGTITFNFVLNQ